MKNDEDTGHGDGERDIDGDRATGVTIRQALEKEVVTFELRPEA